jgi:hypothetical protein
MIDTSRFMGSCGHNRFSVPWSHMTSHKPFRGCLCVATPKVAYLVGPTGLEPVHVWLRARCAATRTQIPIREPKFQRTYDSRGLVRPPHFIFTLIPLRDLGVARVGGFREVFELPPSAISFTIPRNRPYKKSTTPTAIVLGLGFPYESPSAVLPKSLKSHPALVILENKSQSRELRC